MRNQSVIAVSRPSAWFADYQKSIPQLCRRIYERQSNKCFYHPLLPIRQWAVKDKLIFEEIYAPARVKFLNLVECKWEPWKIPFFGIKLLGYMFSAYQMVIGVGTNKRRRILLRMGKLTRGSKELKNLHLIVMGGAFRKNIKNASLCGTRVINVATFG